MKKSVLITGASSGIGAATAIEFSKKGYFVYLLARDPNRLEKIALQCHSGASLLKCDLTDSQQLQKAVQHLRTRQDTQLEVLINNAGNYERTALSEMSMGSFKNQFELNFFSAVHLSKELLPLLKKAKNASIVNVSSTLGLRPTPMSSAYAAAKSALINWTQAMAIEWAPLGIRVNAVAPGIVETPIHAGFSYQSSPADKDKLRNELATKQPLGRIGKPEEIAKAIFFLASDDSSWTTGAILSVDGGINLI